jgi:SNF2 family DNA or RNA helicase
MSEHDPLPIFRPVQVTRVEAAQPEYRPSGDRRNLFIQGGDAQRWEPPVVESFPLEISCVVADVAVWNGDGTVKLRSSNLHLQKPTMRMGVGSERLKLTVQTVGWKFSAAPSKQDAPDVDARQALNEHSMEDHLRSLLQRRDKKTIRQKPPDSMVLLKERLLTLLQPPLENVLLGKKLELPFKPFEYQMEGIAFLMPRHGALLADEMGLGKSMQAILALRLMLGNGDVRRALIICPKPLVPNWLNELKLWAPDIPVEVIAGDSVSRKVAWSVSSSPLKLVNYELLTRDGDLVADANVHFDLVILDEAQRIKNDGNKTAQMVKAIKRSKGWALTGTPIENRPSDLINIWDFIHPGEIPQETPTRELSGLTRDSILRRVKEDVMRDIPAKLIQDVYLELGPAQQEAYERAEKDGIVHLNDLGDTITVQHVFELVMRLKQICNFDPLTGESAKLEQLEADLAEIVESKRKAIVFSQWVQPLELLSHHLREYGPLLFHGRVPHQERSRVLQAFHRDAKKHVLLMSYGAGSVGLNLQCANYVFLFDRWWNPAVEDQAINRAHRIGQKSTVFVKRFVTQNTIECRICDILENKRRLMETIIGQNNSPASLGLSEEEIFGLFSLKPKAHTHRVA